MSEPDGGPRRSFIVAAIVAAGCAYFLIGFTFALPATHAKAWRLGAWLASGVVFAAHIGHEHFRWRHPARVLAWHAAAGVAVGGFLLAVAGAVHSLVTTSTIGPLWLIAFVAWPAFTAIPAFVAAIAVGALLGKLAPR